MGHMDFEIFFLMMIILISIVQMFFYCYFGKMASESYGKIPNCLYKFNWYYLPVNFQRFFIIMIRNAQVPVHYHGFGIAVLDLQTFAQVS